MELNYFEQRDNFVNLEDKLKDVIGMCNSKNLVETFNEKRYFGILDVKNATTVSHYELENGLHVYAFMKDETPINYLISTHQLFDEEYYGSTFINYKYLGGSALQYTAGGIGNSIPIDGINKYYLESTISLLGTDYRNKLGVEISMASGLPLSTNLIGNFNLIECRYDDGTNVTLDKCMRLGDLEGYIANFIFNDRSKTLEREVELEEFNSIFSKVDELHLKVEAERVQGKKSFLKNLLGKNRDLGRIIDAFSKERERSL